MGDAARSLQEEMVSQLHALAAAGDAPGLRALLGRAPALVNAAAGNGWTALMFGARNGHLPVVQLLLQHG